MLKSIKLIVRPTKFLATKSYSESKKVKIKANIFRVSQVFKNRLQDVTNFRSNYAAESSCPDELSDAIRDSA